MEGILKLKKTDSGNRHFIELADGKHKDIHCGSMIEVQLGRWEETKTGEKFLPGKWIGGRYEASLCSEPVTAFLYIGEYYPSGNDLKCVLPLGITVRIPESRCQH